VHSNSLFYHTKAVKACADALGFAARIEVSNYALEIEFSGTRVLLQPRFTYIDPARGLNYTPYFKPEVAGFAGWLPYFNKVWPISLDKLAFKSYAAERGLRIPQYWSQASAGISDFIVKRRGGSFSQGMRGPYRVLDLARPEHRVSEKEYIERFIEGQIAKIWYWNAQPACLELWPFAEVVGDGRLTIRELVTQALRDRVRFADWAAIETTLAYGNRTLSTVLQSGERSTVEFRYGGAMYGLDYQNRNVLDAHLRTELGAQLQQAGKALWQAIPSDIRDGVLYTVDAILDPSGQLWLLEMNPNPAVHPDVYTLMFRAVLERKVSKMPSLAGPGQKDMDAFKGGLVWAPVPPTRRR